MRLLAKLVGIAWFSVVPLLAESDTSPQDVKKLVEAGALVVDVRSVDEYSGGHVSGALNIPHEQVVEGLEKIPKAREKEIVLYCRSGRRSGIAQAALKAAGYSRVHNAGGYSDVVSALK